MFKKAARGFTLIELMIVVAIIGILAAIAIPNFLQYQLKAKRGEGSVNVAAIRTSEISYHAEHGGYLAAPAKPATLPGVSKAPFGAMVALDGFTEIGWQPEGTVYFQYAVHTTAVPGADFTVVAAGDVDGTGAATASCWLYGKGVAGAAPPAATACGNAAVAGWVFDPAAAGNNVERVFLATPGNVF